MSTEVTKTLFNMLKNDETKTSTSQCLAYMETHRNQIIKDYVSSEYTDETLVSGTIHRKTRMQLLQRLFETVGIKMPSSPGSVVYIISEVYELWEKGMTINAKNVYKFLQKHHINETYAFNAFAYYHMTYFIEMLLRENRVNVNTLSVDFLQHPNAATPFQLFISSIEDTESTSDLLEIVRIFLQYGADPKLPFRDGTPLINAPTLIPESRQEIRNLLVNAQQHENDTAWEGWSQSDAQKLDIIFSDTGAKNYSVCPVCLKHLVREDGCMYMHHNCSGMGGYYHKELYLKYKNAHEEIEWCTYCGRICRDHRHFQISPAMGPVPAYAAPTPTTTNVFFLSDCQGANGGGGLPEKIERFRMLRTMARELNEMKETEPLTRITALNTLTEAMWNAPLIPYKHRSVKLLAKQAWNFNTGAFPPNAPVVATAAAAAAIANIQRPAANRDLKPVLIADGWNSVGMEAGPAIQFVHRRMDGTLNDHAGQGIGLESLKDFIKDMNKNFGMEAFGHCWNYGHGCSAYLYPSEVAEAFTLLGEPNEALVAEYTTKFNQRFQGIL